jgi:GcrA cell cycle regulator
MQSNSWQPEHSEALKEYLAKGMSYSGIAKAINAKFNTHYSRNAAIGRAQRMGLVRVGGVQDGPAPSIKSSQPTLRKMRERFEAEFRRRTPIFESVEMNLRCAEVDPLHLTLLQLAPGDCRYPYGGDADDEAITFCGHRQRLGSSYCRAHFELSRGPGTAAERAADIPPRRTIVKAA